MIESHNIVIEFSVFMLKKQHLSNLNVDLPVDSYLMISWFVVKLKKLDDSNSKLLFETSSEILPTELEQWWMEL